MLTQLKSGINRMCNVLAECRSSARRPYQVTLAIVWKDARGRMVHGGARCVDISDSGARIEYHEALPKLTPIQIGTAEEDMVRVGRVRYCTKVGSTHHIGIEFC